MNSLNTNCCCEGFSVFTALVIQSPISKLCPPLQRTMDGRTIRKRTSLRIKSCITDEECTYRRKHNRSLLLQNHHFHEEFLHHAQRTLRQINQFLNRGENTLFPQVALGEQLQMGAFRRLDYAIATKPTKTFCVRLVATRTTAVSKSPGS